MKYIQLYLHSPIKVSSFSRKSPESRGLNCAGGGDFPGKRVGTPPARPWAAATALLLLLLMPALVLRMYRPFCRMTAQFSAFLFGQTPYIYTTLSPIKPRKPLFAELCMHVPVPLAHSIWSAFPASFQKPSATLQVPPVSLGHLLW